MNIELIKKEDHLEIAFFGYIDEEADFSQLNISDMPKIALKLESVSLLNSLGIRLWMNWIKEIPESVEIIFKKCPRIVVDQMNILRGFVPKRAVIESFYVPYYCDACDEDENFLAMRTEHFEAGTSESKEVLKLDKEKKCNKCGQTTEMDVVGAKYFSFLKYRSQ